MNKEAKIGMIVLMLMIILIGSLLVLNKKEKKVEDITSYWGKAYYKYLEDNIKVENQGTKIKEYNFNFYEIQGEEYPIMVIDYEFKEKTYSNIYYISGDEIRFIDAQDPSTVELLYNKEKKKYEYYTNMIAASGGNYYEDVKTQLINSSKDVDDPNRVTSQGYYFLESNSSLPKFDDVFQKVDVKTDVVTIKSNSSELELQKAVVKKIKGYKKVNDIVNEKKD